jgi:hypothetical protein
MSNVSLETLTKLIELEYLDYEDGRLTAKGKKAATEFASEMETSKLKRSKASKARYQAMRGLGLTKTRSGAWESKELNEEESDSELASSFEKEFEKRLKIGKHGYRLRSLSPSMLYIDYINLPMTPTKEPAEKENNRISFVIHYNKATGRGKAETSVCALDRKWRLRAKTATPEKLAVYIAGHINKIFKEVPPKYTHSKPPTESSSKVISSLLIEISSQMSDNPEPGSPKRDGKGPHGKGRGLSIRRKIRKLRRSICPDAEKKADV